MQQNDTYKTEVKSQFLLHGEGGELFHVVDGIIKGKKHWISVGLGTKQIIYNQVFSPLQTHA